MNRQLIIVLAVLVLIVGSIGFFFYRMYADLQMLKSQVAVLSDVSTSTAPLVRIGSGIVQNNFAGLCILSNNPQICQAAGITPPQQTNPTP
jgi:hypothetical protein